MQNVLLPGAVVLLTVVLWLRRKPLKPMLSSTDASGVAQLNRAQLELVIEPASLGSSPNGSLEAWTAPTSQLERLAGPNRRKAPRLARRDRRASANRGQERRSVLRRLYGLVRLRFPQSELD